MRRRATSEPHRVETRTSWGHEYRVNDLVDEFSARLREELDYRIEARNAHAIDLNRLNRK